MPCSFSGLFYQYYRLAYHDDSPNRKQRENENERDGREGRVLDRYSCFVTPQVLALPVTGIVRLKAELDWALGIQGYWEQSKLGNASRYMACYCHSWKEGIALYSYSRLPYTSQVKR